MASVAAHRCDPEEVLEECRQLSHCSSVGCAILTDVLANGHKVDFSTITELCDHAATSSSEMNAIVTLLVDTVLDEQSDVAQQLKALTVVHEMLYSEHACKVLSNAAGLPEALQHIHGTVSHEHAGPANECIRLFAAEISRRLFPSEAPQEILSTSALTCRVLGSVLANAASSLSFGAAACGWNVLRRRRDRPTTSIWSGTFIAAENLAKQLRRHSQVRHSSWAQIVVDMLDEVFQAIDELATAVARVEEEMSSMDEVRKIEAPLVPAEQNLRALLSLASDVQQSALEWKCRFVATPASTKVDSRAGAQLILAAPLASFFEEVVALGAALEARLPTYTAT